MAQTIIIEGAGKFLDGMYDPKNTTGAETTCYEKQGREEVFLCSTPSGYWLAQPKSKIGTNVGYMMSGARNFGTPVGAGPWSIFKDSRWHPRPNIVVSPDIAAISVTVAWMGLGSLVVIAMVVKLALAMRPAMRETLYLSVCATFTAFIPYTALKSITNFFPANSSLLELLFGIAVFAGSNFFMNHGAWKCQFDFHRVSGICWLGSFCAGFSGIFAAHAAQELSKETLAQEISPSVISTETTEVIGVLVVALLVMLLLGIARMAAEGWRAQSMTQEPAVLWCTRKMITRTKPQCWIFGVSSDIVPASAKFEWQDFVKWGEDVASTLIGSFALYQWVLYVTTSHLPAVEQSLYLQGSSFWAATGLAFVIAGLAVGVASAKDLTAMQRPVRVPVLSAAFVGSWATFRLLSFLIVSVFPDSELAPAAAAFLATVLGLSLMYVVGGSALGSSPGLGVCYLGIAVGTVCGLAWGHLFWASVRVSASAAMSAAGVKDTQLVETGFKFTVSTLLVAVASLVWWNEILPRRNLLNEHHEKMIRLEQSSFIAA